MLQSSVELIAKISVILQKLEQQVKKRKQACLVYGVVEEVKQYYSILFKKVH